MEMGASRAKQQISSIPAAAAVTMHFYHCLCFNDRLSGEPKQPDPLGFTLHLFW